jgi:hypothetical protein
VASHHRRRRFIGSNLRRHLAHTADRLSFRQADLRGSLLNLEGRWTIRA